MYRPRIAAGASALFGCLILAACMASSPTNLTPAQRLYAADGAYRSLLELVVAYKEACFARPVEQQVFCRTAVEKLRAIDRQYSGVRGQFVDVPPTLEEAARIETFPVLLQAALETALAVASGDEAKQEAVP